MKTALGVTAEVPWTTAVVALTDSAGLAAVGAGALGLGAELLGKDKK